MKKDKIKEEVLKESKKIKDVVKGCKIMTTEECIDLAISKTAQAIFDDISLLNGEDGMLHLEDYEELKKKWCEK